MRPIVDMPEEYRATENGIVRTYALTVKTLLPVTENNAFITDM